MDNRCAIRIESQRGLLRNRACRTGLAVLPARHREQRTRSESAAEMNVCAGVHVHVHEHDLCIQFLADMLTFVGARGPYVGPRDIVRGFPRCEVEHFNVMAHGHSDGCWHDAGARAAPERSSLASSLCEELLSE